MSGMFSSCRNISILDVSNIETKNVTNMEGMFQYCENLLRLDLTNINTINITDMQYMFRNCYKLTTLDLSDFDTRNVTNMNYMFMGCRDLTTIYVSEKFQVTSVIYGSELFNDCKKLIGGEGTIFNTDYTDYTYAKIDEGVSNPGYFTDSFKIDNYTLDGSYIKGIQPNTVYKDFAQNVHSAKTYIIKEGEKVLTDTDVIKTGQVLTVGENTYILVVTGDTNGDGKADIKDIMQINKHRLNKVQLTNVYLDAGDVNGDGKADIKDIMQINKYRLGKIANL